MERHRPNDRLSLIKGKLRDGNTIVSRLGGTRVLAGGSEANSSRDIRPRSLAYGGTRPTRALLDEHQSLTNTKPSLSPKPFYSPAAPPSIQLPKKSPEVAIVHQPQTANGCATCPHCKRSFSTDRLGKHAAVCQKVFSKKRKQFSSFAHRINNLDSDDQRIILSSVRKPAQVGTAGAIAGSGRPSSRGLPSNILAPSAVASVVSTRPGGSSVVAGKNKSSTNWRVKSEHLRSVLRSLRKGGDHGVEKGISGTEKGINSLSVSTSMFEPEPLVTCGSCGRRFSEDAVKRHEPVCHSSQSKKWNNSFSRGASPSPQAFLRGSPAPSAGLMMQNTPPRNLDTSFNSSYLNRRSYATSANTTPKGSYAYPQKKLVFPGGIRASAPGTTAGAAPIRSLNRSSTPTESSATRLSSRPPTLVGLRPTPAGSRPSVISSGYPRATTTVPSHATSGRGRLFESPKMSVAVSASISGTRSLPRPPLFTGGYSSSQGTASASRHRSSLSTFSSHPSRLMYESMRF